MQKTIAFALCPDVTLLALRQRQNLLERYDPIIMASRMVLSQQLDNDHISVHRSSTFACESTSTYMFDH